MKIAKLLLTGSVIVMLITLLTSSPVYAQQCTGNGSTTYPTYSCYRDPDTLEYSCLVNGSVTNRGECGWHDGLCSFLETNEPHCAVLSDDAGCIISNQCGGMWEGTCYAPNGCRIDYPSPPPGSSPGPTEPPPPPPGAKHGARIFVFFQDNNGNGNWDDGEPRIGPAYCNSGDPRWTSIAGFDIEAPATNWNGMSKWYCNSTMGGNNPSCEPNPGQTVDILNNSCLRGPKSCEVYEDEFYEGWGFFCRNGYCNDPRPDNPNFFKELRVGPYYASVGQTPDSSSAWYLAKLYIPPGWEITNSTGLFYNWTTNSWDRLNEYAPAGEAGVEIGCGMPLLAYGVRQKTITLQPPTSQCLATGTEVVLTWTSSGAGVSYTVDRCTNSTCSSPTVLTTTTALTYTDRPPTGIPYYYRVRDIAGGISSNVRGPVTLNCTGDVRARAIVDTTGLLSTCSDYATLTSATTAAPAATGAIVYLQNNQGGSYHDLSGASYTVSSNAWNNFNPQFSGFGYQTRVVTSGMSSYFGSTWTLCWCDNSTGTCAQGAHPLVYNSTLSFNVLFQVPSGWFQVSGGNVHSNGDIVVQRPSGRYFVINNESSLRPGVMSRTTTTGQSVGSSDVVPNTAIAVDAVHPATDYYQTYHNKFPSPSILPNSVISMPGSGYYDVPSGDLSISTNSWQVPSTSKIVIFVHDNLKISDIKIRVANGGFLAFIVHGNIEIDTSVGQTTPVLTQDAGGNPLISDRFGVPDITGVFISDGSFITDSGIGGVVDKQLIGAGTFVASQFTLQRDLGTDNGTYPGEYFVYRPDLWVNAPEEFKDLDVKWQEVAP